ncbi:MAG: pentapeptide repeat-containing protein [Deltaproteobacteria bacterium]|nr:pentapeptide repeat-containing protein [Deltaproteobacteria bacterium]
MPEPKCNWRPPNADENAEYSCVHEPLTGRDKCIFHADIKEKEDDPNLRDLFVVKLKEKTKKFDWDFRGFKFPGEFDWEKIGIREFSPPNTRKANFRWAEFGDNIRFAYTKFNKGAIFDRVVFRGKVNFSHATFDDKTGFQSTTFKGETLFSQLKTTRKDTLDYSGLEGGPFEAGAPWLIFNKTIFGGPTMIRRNDLSNARFQGVDLSNVSFIDSKINKTRFIDCKWGDGFESKWKYKRNGGGFYRFRQHRLLFDELLLRKYRLKKGDQRKPDGEPVEQVKINRSLTPGDIETLGLQLKQSFESMRDPVTAGDFHFGLMEMKRICAWDGRKKIDGKDLVFRSYRFFRASMLWLYKMVNGYGERCGRNVIWLVLLVLFFCIYFASDGGLRPNGLPPEIVNETMKLNWHDYLLYSLQNILPLKFGQQYVYPYSAGARWGSFVETFMGTTLFTFLILALRRRYKR